MELAGRASRTTYFPSLWPLVFELLKCVAAAEVSSESSFNKETKGWELLASELVRRCGWGVRRECGQALGNWARGLSASKLLSFSFCKHAKQRVSYGLVCCFHGVMPLTAGFIKTVPVCGLGMGTMNEQILLWGREGNAPQPWRME